VIQLLNSAALLLLAQGALILQPTHTAQQKKEGTYTHAVFNDLALAAFIAAWVVIEVNKYKNGIPHFESPHAILGFITYLLLIIQAFIGFTQYFVPSLYGGVDKAKKIYKYHRVAGYSVFTLALATVCAATQTTFNKNVFDIKLWATIVLSVIILAGIVPRIKKQKLGL
jgi:Eukaryotic cytochrome b561